MKIKLKVPQVKPSIPCSDLALGAAFAFSRSNDDSVRIMTSKTTYLLFSASGVMPLTLRPDDFGYPVTITRIEGALDAC